MISAWDVYWVMQLDSIGASLGFAGFVSLAAGVVSLFFWGLNRDLAKIYQDATYPEGQREFARYSSAERGTKRVAKFSIPLAVGFLMVNAFLPSSKTAAAMIVLPAIANNEALKKEAGELYGLAKQALKDAVAPDKTE